MKIKIKEPCDADWNKMKIGMKSRHCELCVKSVMDFTQMTREEILIYLFKNNNKSTCARMYGGQMDFHFQELEAIVEGTRRQKGNLPFVVLSFAALAMISCENKSGNSVSNSHEIGKIIQVEAIDSIKSSTDTTDVNLKKGIVEKEKDKFCGPKRGEVQIMTGSPIPVPGSIEIETGDIVSIPHPETGGMIELYPEPENNSMGAVIPGIDEFELMGDTTVLTEEDIQKYAVLNMAEVMPEYPHGADSLLNYLKNEIRYPKKAQKKGIEGRVYVQFVVEKDGRISRTKILRGIGEGCDEEALRVINNMPNWIPGENQGRKVAVMYTLPIKFVLK